MSRPTEYRIFLASSQELAPDRQAFAELLRRRNDDWVGRGVHLRLVVWEDFLDAMSKTRLQAEYNAAITSCDLFVMLFHTKVGPYTEEEFNTAFGQFQASGKPFVYTYFKSAPVDPDALDPADLASRQAFQARLKALGHFQTRYANVEALQGHFWQQLDKLVANGFIRFPAADDAGTGTQYNATLTGDGAIAQGPNATALGAGAVQIKGSVSGTVNTGTLTINHSPDALWAPRVDASPLRTPIAIQPSPSPPQHRVRGAPFILNVPMPATVPAEGSAGAEPPEPAGASAGAAAPEAAPPPAAEPVLLAASAPRQCAAGEGFTAALAAYVASARDAALQHLQQLGETGDRVVSDLAPGDAHWAVGAPVSVRLAGDGFDVTPAEQSFHWNGRLNSVAFDVQVRADASAGKAALWCHVALAGVPMAAIPLRVAVTAATSAPVAAAPQTEPLQQADAAAPRSAFASYSSKDASDVTARLSTLLRWAPGLDIFQDCLDLQPNEAFKPQLAAQIGQRDVFLLFWSRNAAASPWVHWEFETASAAKGLQAIVPMPLEDPSVAPPPPELADLHMRDRFMLARYGLQKIREEAVAAGRG